jgi:PPP family 3-phenylpropionic acid transporter
VRSTSPHVAGAPASRRAIIPFGTLVLGALWTLTGGALGCVLPFLAIYAGQRGLSLGAIGLLGAISAGASALGQPLVGRLVQRTGRRRAILVGALLLGSLSFAALGHVAATPLLILCATLGNAGFFSARVVIIETTVNWLEASGHGAVMMARYRVCPAVGYTLTGLAGGQLLNHVPFYLVFTAGSLLFALAALFGLALPTIAAHQATLKTPDETVGHGLRARRTLLTLSLMSLLYGIVTSSSDTYLPLLMRHLHGSFTQVGLAGTLPAMAEIPLMIVVGSLADRISRPVLLAAGLLAVPARFALYALAAAPLALLAAQPLDGLSFCIYAVVGVAVLTDGVPRQERAWAISIFSASNTIGPILGPLIAGLLASSVGLQPMYGIIGLAAIAVPATVAIGLWPRLVQPR